MREYAARTGVPFPAEPYVCNVLKCRPPGNKLLADGADIAACSTLYHPAYLLRRRYDKALHAETWADLKLAVEGLR